MRSFARSSIRFCSLASLFLSFATASRASWDVLPEPRFFPLSAAFGWAHAVERDRDGKNIEEWRNYLGGTATEEDARQMVYGTTLTDLTSLRKLLDAGTEPASPESAPLAASRRLLRKPERREALEHLLLAKRAEPYMEESEASLYSYSKTPPNPDYEELTRDYRSLYPLAKSDFIRARIGYQLTRLARYAGKYEDAVAFYDRYLPETLAAGAARWWALEHKATSLQRLGRTPEANLLYVRIAANAPELRSPAVLHFDVRSDEAWAALMKQCGTDAERATAHALRGLNASANRLEELKAIRRLDPMNPALTEILAREIRWIDHTFSTSKEFAEGKPLFAGSTGKIIAEDIDFIAAALAEKNVPDPEVWRLALRYLSRLAGRRVPKEAETPALKERAELLDFVADVATLDKPSDERVMALLERLKRIETGKRDPQAEYGVYRNYFFKRIGGLHERTGDLAVGRLSALAAAAANRYGPPPAFWQSRDLPFVEALEKLLLKPEKGRFERLLLSGGREGKDQPRDVWWDLAGGHALGQGRFDDAIAHFGRVRDKARLALYRDPFEVRLLDFASPPAVPVTDKIAVARRMKELKAASRGTGPDAARALMGLGVAYYDISYFGRSWMMTSPYSSAYMMDEEITPADYWFDLRPAVDALERAEILLRDEDPESAAQCAFMLAKCKGVSLPAIRESGAWDKTDFTPQREAQYQRLNSDYSNTRFYKMAVKECWTFGRWAEGR